MPLSDAAARNAKPREKSYRITDAKGMYLEVTPIGGKYWRMKYRFGGKVKVTGQTSPLLIRERDI